MTLRSVIASFDWVLAGAALLLVLIGLAMAFSSADTADLLSSRFIRQGGAFVVAAIVAVLVARVPYHAIARYAVLLYAIALSGLVVVYFAGQVIRGTTSRLSIGDFQLQPSEFMKVALIIMLAWVFSRQQRLTWRTVLASAVLVGIPAGFVLLEPDVGVAGLLLSLWGALLVFVGLPWIAITVLGLFGLGGFFAAWKWFLADYQRARVLVFVDPTRDPLGAGYNIVQSIVALGSGRLIGRGLGHGPQSQLQFLPERHTDFILASIGEELGFVGVVVVLVLYVIVLWRLLRIARTTRDTFGQTIAVATFLLLLISLTVSAGMNMGLLPVTGIPLPLLSYGGSNLMTTFVLLGLVQSVHVYSKWVQPPPTEISTFT